MAEVGGTPTSATLVAIAVSLMLLVVTLPGGALAQAPSDGEQVEGVLLDEEGEPVPDGKVYLVEPAKMVLDVLEGPVETDDEGSFALDRGNATSDAFLFATDGRE